MFEKTLLKIGGRHSGRTKILIAVLLLLFTLAVDSALTDDGFMGGIGGDLKPQNSPDIEMVEEHVRIDAGPTAARYESEYIFKNTGKAQTVVMGFPEQRADPEYNVDESIIRNFKAYDNGKPLTVNELKLDPEKTDYSHYNIWHTHNVNFAAGETKIIKTVYNAIHSGWIAPEGEGYVYHISYILETGSLWKGKIGKVRIDLHLKSGLTFDDFKTPGNYQYETESWVKGKYRIQPAGYKFKGNSLITWVFTEFEPEKEDNISIDTFQDNSIVGRVYSEASSFLVLGDYAYPPAFACDGQPGTAWAEGAPGDGSGQWLLIPAETTLVAGGFRINPGYSKTKELFRKYARPKKVTLAFSNGSKESFLLDDQPGEKSFTFSMHETSATMLIIDEVYPGTYREDCFITEVALDYIERNGAYLTHEDGQKKKPASEKKAAKKPAGDKPAGKTGDRFTLYVLAALAGLALIGIIIGFLVLKNFGKK